MYIGQTLMSSNCFNQANIFGSFKKNTFWSNNVIMKKKHSELWLMHLRPPWRYGQKPVVTNLYQWSFNDQWYSMNSSITHGGTGNALARLQIFLHYNCFFNVNNFPLRQNMVFSNNKALILVIRRGGCCNPPPSPVIGCQMLANCYL